MEKVDCNFCGCNKYRVIHDHLEDFLSESKILFRLVKCIECGLIYLNPRPSKEEILKFYPEDYAAHNPVINSELVTSGFTQQIRIYYYSLFVDKIIKNPVLESLKTLKPGRAIDCGCGFGTYMEHLSKRGWEVVGTDINEVSVNHVRKMGFGVFKGELKEAKFFDNAFDLILFNHSLEHMHNPFEAIAEAYRIINKDGLLLIRCPNIAGLPYRIFKRYWFPLDIPRHLYHFSPLTLSPYLKNIGFSIEHIRYDVHPHTVIKSLIRISNDKLKFLERSYSSSLATLSLTPLTFTLAKLGFGDILVLIAKKIT